MNTDKIATDNLVKGYLDDLGRLIQAVDVPFIEGVVEALLLAWHKGNRVLLMGNGGSSSTVSHIVADMQKNIQLSTGKPLRALCLSDCTPLLMAWANDTEWSNVFAPQVACWVQHGDIVIGVSGSGNSMNVINGIEAARRCGAITFGLAGYDGGKLAATAHHSLVVPSNNMQRVEDMHMVVLHMIFLAVEQRAMSDLQK